MDLARALISCPPGRSGVPPLEAFCGRARLVGPAHADERGAVERRAFEAQHGADKLGAETLLSGIIAMVERAQNTRMPIQALVDRITLWFVPAVMALAAFTFIVWLAFGPSLAVALTHAVAVLIIACPCAMGLATPVSIMVGMGRAASLGVLFRQGDKGGAAYIVNSGAVGIFREAGYGADDVTWAIVTFADGAVVNFGVSYALPAKYPTLGQSDRVELLGTEGTMIIDDDHMDHVLYSDKGIPHAYVPDHAVNMAFLGSNTAGDWAVGDFWGPLGNETRAWLDHLVTGHPTVHTTPEQAMVNLQTTIAIERSARDGKPVRLPLET